MPTSIITKAGYAPRVDGTLGNDTLVGALTLKNTIYGGAGDDLIVGGSAGDTLVGEAGNDTVIGGAGNDGIWGGGGNDSISGGAGNDYIAGDGGNDTLDGGLGADTLVGGTGNDAYIVDDVGDVVVENAGEGIDTVQSSITYTLTANVENLILTGTANIDGTGNGLDNVLTGNAGDNVLDGGLGADTMAGGAGNDTYIVDNVGDVVIEIAGAGIDTVKTAMSYALGANVENLVLTGSANLNGTGNDLNNVLTGNAGDNILDGGQGADTMAGGQGNDTYIVDNIGDVVIEAAGEGIDTIRASVSYTLAANVENLVFVGTAAANGVGNASNNVMTGNAGDNVLDGGAGADTMGGGLGNDTYIVDHAGDVVIENSGEGIDTVRSSIDYTLGANVENLILTGSANLAGSGNDLGNMLTGNAGDNVLNGGLGADTMAGGFGNDTYIVDTAGDVVIEIAGAGIDTVKTQMSYTLGANVENLTLTGTANLVGTGNALDNLLMGNAGNDSLYGGLGNDTIIAGNGTNMLDGGAGSDVLYGGQGNDFLNGGADADILFGGAGNDGFFGGGGNDTVSGGDGNDRVYGDGGNDVIQGGAGNDTMTGGAINGLGDKGANTYLWDKSDVVKADGTSAGLDRITDFGTGDKLDFSGLFKGTASSDPGHFLHVTDTASGTVISADVGAGHFIDIVVLDNVHNVTLDDLLHNHAIVV